MSASSLSPVRADRDEEEEPPPTAEDMALSGSIFSSGRVSTVSLLSSSCWIIICMVVSSSTISVPEVLVFSAAATCI